jgi:hypothetical protein
MTTNKKTKGTDDIPCLQEQQAHLWVELELLKYPLVISEIPPPKASRGADLGLPCQLVLFDPIGEYTAPAQQVYLPAIAR